jgi:hypothetical protein
MRTEHECVRIERCQCNEQATKAATYVCKLRRLSRASKGGIVHAPVYLIWGGRVLEIMI